MFIAKRISEIRSQLKNGNNGKIAFVPTMGALHDGHLALIKKASILGKKVVVSIFVNQTQFNDPKDYEKYPRQIAEDLQKLKNSGATDVFVPDVNEMFSADFSFKIIPTYLADCLCGVSRPGHFDGVALIVTKLFNIIKPDFAVFGEKDFQQVAIIKKLVDDLNFPIKIIVCETLREKNGLAMSSRNQNLDDASKIKAASIFRILTEIKNELKKSPQDLQKILQKNSEKLLQIGFTKIDYLELRDERNLQLITEFNSQNHMRLFIAANLAGVRLIDNLAL